MDAEKMTDEVDKLTSIVALASDLVCEHTAITEQIAEATARKQKIEEHLSAVCVALNKALPGNVAKTPRKERSDKGKTRPDWRVAMAAE